MNTKTPSFKPSFPGPEGQEDMPYLLTPGPLTTSRTVKLAMLADWGSRDVEFRKIVGDIRKRILQLANCDGRYECVIMQGSGHLCHRGGAWQPVPGQAAQNPGGCQWRLWRPGGADPGAHRPAIS